MSTVKRRREKHGLGSNCPNNNKGQLGEQLVAEYFRQQGLEVTLPAKTGGPYDLLVNGLRVDVKVGQARTTEGGLSYQFRLPVTRSSYRASKTYGKNYAVDADLLALAVLKQDELVHLYLLPCDFWQPTNTVKPDSHDCDYRDFTDIHRVLEYVASTAPSGAA